MLASRLERCYNSNNNNAPTHTVGFQIDYPPPPPPPQSLLQNNAKLSRTQIHNPPGANSSSVPLGKEVPPPLPPKMFINMKQGNGMRPPAQLPTLTQGNGIIIKDGKQQYATLAPLPIRPHHQLQTLMTGSGFILGKPDNNNLQDQDKEVPGTWSGGMEIKASSLLDSHDRFKPERSQRRLVQRMKWSQSRWGRSLAGDLFSYSMGPPTPLDLDANKKGFISSPPNGHPSYYNHVSLPPLPVESESRVSSMTIADVSPRLALKKVLLLYEHAQYKEAATFIQRLSVGTFRIILRELPMDLFVEAMPHSLPILESLYSKIYNAEGPRVDLQPLKPEPLVMYMVKFFSREDITSATQMNRMRTKDSPGPFTLGCKKILGVIVVSEPNLMKRMKERARILDKIVEGMGQHGLVGTTDESLMPLHDALKLEFQQIVETYKGALQKLEDLALSNKSNPKSVAKGPAPVNASHQRQLSLRAEEIQDRLIKNKSILNAVEPTLDNNCLDILLGILQRRIEVDKEALFQFTQLRKETGDVVNNSDASVAPLLMRYSRGLKQVLELMREVGKEVGAFAEGEEEADSSDLSGYHSDSDSAIMTSGNSPFVSPRARYNFLSRSVRSKQGYRPSLLHSTWGGGSFAKTQGPGSCSSSVPGGNNTTTGDNNRPVGNPGPIRPRHVKIKNQLHKNNSLGKVSTASTDSASSTSGCGASLTNSEEDASLTGSSSPDADCVEECITVVSVPDNQVITQGVVHRCANKGQHQHSPTSSTSSDGDMVQELRMEVLKLKRQLQSANSTIYQMQQENNGLPPGGLLKKVQTEMNSKQDQIRSDRRAELVREYGGLYAQARVETMDALDALPELNDADELKSKLLFSVVVLAFRSVQTRLAEIKDQVSGLLQFQLQNDKEDKDKLGPTQAKLVEALSEYLLTSQQRFDQSRCVEHVASQLWTTLYDYPCLRKSEGLLKYIHKCVNLAWRLSNQTPPCILDYETRTLSKSLHVRFHTSDHSSETVKTYLWPALIESATGQCIHKGVVLT